MYALMSEPSPLVADRSSCRHGCAPAHGSIHDANTSPAIAAHASRLRPRPRLDRQPTVLSLRKTLLLWRSGRTPHLRWLPRRLPFATMVRRGQPSDQSPRHAVSRDDYDIFLTRRCSPLRRRGESASETESSARGKTRLGARAEVERRAGSSVRLRRESQAPSEMLAEPGDELDANAACAAHLAGS